MDKIDELAMMFVKAENLVYEPDGSITIKCHECLKFLTALFQNPNAQNMIEFARFYCRAMDIINKYSDDGVISINELDMIMNMLMPDDFYNEFVRYVRQNNVRCESLLKA
jgi:hypothetical protein